MNPGGAASCTPPAAGLVAWWPWNQSSVDVISGAPAVLLGGPVYAPGLAGPALRFDGVDDGARAPGSAGLDVGAGDGLTVEAWIRPDNVQNPGALVEWAGSNSSSLGVHFTLASDSPGSLYANLIDSAGSAHSFSSPGGLVRTGQWQHVALTYDRTGGVARLFLNGTSIVQQTVGTFRPETRPDLHIGQRVVGGTPYRFRGALDELSIYGRALDLTEIARIVQAGSAGKCLTNPPPPGPTNCVPVPVGLAGWWPWNQSSVDVISGANAVLLGGLAYVPGLVGPALRFDGVDDGARAPGSAKLDVGAGDGLTVEAWIRPDSVQSPGALVEWAGSSVGLGVHFTLASDSPGSLYANLIDSAGSAHSFSSPGGLVRTGQWQHVALTYDRTGGVARLFLNGTSIVQQTVGTFRPETRLDLHIGQRVVGGTPYRFRGALDELSIYSRALDPMEILSIYDAGSQGKCQLGPPVDPNCVLASSGLTSWLPLDGDALDVVGGQAGVLAGQPAFVNGVVAQGLRFDGIDDSVRVPASPATDVGAGSGLTAELWINPQQVSSSAALLEWSPPTGIAVGLHLYTAQQFAGSLYANLIDSSGVSHAFSSPPGVVSSGVFQHVALTYDRNSGVAHLFVNGTQVASNTVGSFRLETRPDLYLGRRVLGGTAYRYSGVMDEISLYDRALSQAEIAAIFGAGASGKCRTNLPLPPSHVRVVSTTAPSNGVASVPVRLAARGDENALGFSLQFNPALLAFRSATLADGLPTGTSLVLNTNDPGSGRIGLALALPANAVLPVGTQEVIRVQFQVGLLLDGATIPIDFANHPITMQVADVLARPVPAVFTGGSVTVRAAEFEADVAPRPAGDRTIQVIDWVQAGRFAAGLDVAGPNEFTRIDCAPRSTRGDGIISAADFVQTGRYMGQLDPLTLVGGPAGPGPAFGRFRPAGNIARTVSVPARTIGPASAFTVPLLLEAQGNENALGLSIVFDPAKLNFAGASNGTDAQSATLAINSALQNSGKVGFILGLPPGQTFGAGVREVLSLSFVAAENAVGTSEISFGDEPALQEVVDVSAGTQPATFTAGRVTFQPVTVPGPVIAFTRSGDTLVLAWPASAVGFDLEGTTGAFGAPWTAISSFSLVDQRMAIVPISGEFRFFRLKKP